MGAAALILQGSLLAGSLMAASAAHAANHETRQDVRSVCRQAMEHRGLRPSGVQHDNFNEAAGTYGWSGQFGHDGRRYEFNCVVSTDMHVRDLAVNPLGDEHHGGDHGHGHGAPAEVQVACAEEAARYWKLPVGTAVPGATRSTGSGMYEVKLSGRHHRGTCTVTERGDVRGIMND